MGIPLVYSICICFAYFDFCCYVVMIYFFCSTWSVARILQRTLKASASDNVYIHYSHYSLRWVKKVKHMAEVSVHSSSLESYAHMPQSIHECCFVIHSMCRHQTSILTRNPIFNREQDKRANPPYPYPYPWWGTKLQIRTRIRIVRERTSRVDIESMNRCPAAKGQSLYSGTPDAEGCKERWWHLQVCTRRSVLE